MGKWLAIIAGLLVAVVTGCAPAVPKWREEARAILDKARQDGADRMLPTEYHSMEDTLVKGEVLLQQEDVEGADEFYRFALLKGKALEKDLAAEKQRLAEEARRKAEEEQRELSRLQALKEEEERRLAEEKERLALIQMEKEEKERRRKEKERSLPLLTHYTVKRGETLPLIAALPEVYNDSALWPLLYRANRDQIRDPKRIWPGQVLRIPRNLSREDIAEARRNAQEKPLR
jgi:hypothetical protein